MTAPIEDDKELADIEKLLDRLKIPYPDKRVILFLFTELRDKAVVAERDRLYREINKAIDSTIEKFIAVPKSNAGDK